MSTLAAARADNFYYPPEFDPVKHKSLAKFTGQHPLRERAKKLDQGILVIRFEVPFNIWCGKCGEMIAKGVRFNAEKKQVGSYHSTKILEFSMHHHCGCKIVITTDPKNAEYLVTQGARRKVEEYTAAQAEVIELIGPEEKAKLDDPLYKLEYAHTVKHQAISKQSRMTSLKEQIDMRHEDPYTINKAMRAKLRAAKKEDAQLEHKRQTLGLAEGIKLLRETEGDRIQASVAFLHNESRYKNNETARRQRILDQSIFQQPGSSSKKPAAAGGGSSGNSSGTARKTQLLEKTAQLAKRRKLSAAGLAAGFG